MKPFVKIFSVALLVLALFVSCEDSDDNNPSPVPDVRDKFVGTWNVTENCNKGNYVASISKDPSNSARILLSNFADSQAGQPDTALVASGTAHLYAQINSEGWYLEGNGTYNADGTIGWQFTLEISGFREDCSATWTRAE